MSPTPPTRTVQLATAKRPAHPPPQCSPCVRPWPRSRMVPPTPSVARADGSVRASSMHAYTVRPQAARRAIFASVPTVLRSGAAPCSNRSVVAIRAGDRAGAQERFGRRAILRRTDTRPAAVPQRRDRLAQPAAGGRRRRFARADQCGACAGEHVARAQPRGPVVVGLDAQTDRGHLRNEVVQLDGIVLDAAPLEVCNDRPHTPGATARRLVEAKSVEEEKIFFLQKEKCFEIFKGLLSIA